MVTSVTQVGLYINYQVGVFNKVLHIIMACAVELDTHSFPSQGHFYRSFLLRKVWGNVESCAGSGSDAVSSKEISTRKYLLLFEKNFDNLEHLHKAVNELSAFCPSSFGVECLSFDDSDTIQKLTDEHISYLNSIGCSEVFVVDEYYNADEDTWFIKSAKIDLMESSTRVVEDSSDEDLGVSPL